MTNTESPIEVVNGIPHIHIFEKHYITLALENEIAKYQQILADTEELLKTDPANESTSRLRTSLEAAPGIYKRMILDLQTTLKRVESLQEVP